MVCTLFLLVNSNRFSWFPVFHVHVHITYIQVRVCWIYLLHNDAACQRYVYMATCVYGTVAHVYMYRNASCINILLFIVEYHLVQTFSFSLSAYSALTTTEVCLRNIGWQRKVSLIYDRTHSSAYIYSPLHGRKTVPSILIRALAYLNGRWIKYSSFSIVVCTTSHIWAIRVEMVT